MKGFINIGNTCYLNSGLQMLIQNIQFCQLVLKYASYSPVLSKIALFIKEYYTNNNTPLNPAEIKNIVQEKQNIFYGFSQQDSSEFIIILLDIIDEEIKKIHKKYNMMNENNIDSIYGLEINSRIKCKKYDCLNIVNKIEKTNFLILELKPEFKTLDDIYLGFKSKEKLIDDNKYKCDKCNALRDASKRNNVSKWSNHLFIWLKRFKQLSPNQYIKNEQKIDIPVEWRHNMRLKGAVIHTGGLNGGHYVYISNINDKWYLFNDSNVSLIDSSRLDLYLNNAYWLYYVSN
jgi:ubiquitin C-terminal hydrolase